MTECKTTFGKFRIKVSSGNISVGGLKYCVNISMPSEQETVLYWLSTEEGGCSLDNTVIKGDSTIKMVDLAFSLVRKQYPSRKKITLLDDSGTSWIERHGIKKKINLLKSHLFFHGKTWYEDRFDATMCDPTIFSEYNNRKKNFTDPSKKPKEFFLGTYNEELAPIYKSSTTWKEFADKIQEKYGRSKYQMINDWYRQAIYIIFDGMEINQNWQINMENRQCEPTLKGGAGARKTRQNRAYYPLEPYFEERS
jgi:hypothetical protein